MNIHRPKLRWSPKLGHMTHRRICPSIRDRLIDDAKPSTLSPSEMTTDPKLKTRCAWGGCVCNRTRSGSVPEQVWTRHRPATGTGPVNFCRCERYTNEWNVTETWPERDRNGTGTRTGTGVNTALYNWIHNSCESHTIGIGRKDNWKLGSLYVKAV